MKNLWGIVRARGLLFKRIRAEFPNAHTMKELPQELVHSFDVLTEIADMRKLGILLPFEIWWNLTTDW